MKHVTFEIEEALLIGFRPSADLGASIGFKIARDDLNTDQAEYLRTHLGRRFALVLVEIGDDEKPVIIEEPKEKKPRNRIAQFGGMRRNDPIYQAVLIDYFRERPGYEWIEARQAAQLHNLRDPVTRRKVVAEIQHQFCGVKSLADITPNTEASLCFDLLETLFEADKQGLPPPNMEPNVYHIVSHVRE